MQGVSRWLGDMLAEVCKRPWLLPSSLLHFSWN